MPCGWKTRKMCYKDAGYPVSALKFILNWFVTDKMVKNLHGDLFFDNGILFFDEDFVDTTFFDLEIGNLSEDLEKWRSWWC